MPNVSGLMTKKNISEVQEKILNHDKYIATPEFNKSTVENFTAR